MTLFNNRKSKGSSMIEVLIALVILSLAALGAAGMQVIAKKSSHEAQQRSTATYLVNSIIEKMRNNPASLAVYAGNNVGGGSIAVAPSQDCSAIENCNSVQLAAHDRWLWEQEIDGAAVQAGGNKKGGLVQAKGCITNNAGQVQVVIAWRGSEKTSDAGRVDACGTASSHRRQLVVNTFIN